MAIIWAARLAWHLYTRWRGHGEDPRYAKMLGKAKAKGAFASAALKFVFAPQALLLFLTCLPAQLGILASVIPESGALFYAAMLMCNVVGTDIYKPWLIWQEPEVQIT